MAVVSAKKAMVVKNVMNLFLSSYHLVDSLKVGSISVSVMSSLVSGFGFRVSGFLVSVSDFGFFSDFKLEFKA
jgi:hypothetical protein